MANLAWDSKARMQKVADGPYVRERSADLYHTARWTKLSKAFRASHPLCAECASKGIIKPAQVTDHIIPYPVCGKDGFFDTNNLQALCEECNHKKGQSDKMIIAHWRREQAHTGGMGV